MTLEEYEEFLESQKQKKYKPEDYVEWLNRLVNYDYLLDKEIVYKEVLRFSDEDLDLIEKIYK